MKPFVRLLQNPQKSESSPRLPVKFCGICRPEDIEALNALPIQAAGFVFYSPSLRSVSFEQAAKLRAMLHPDIAAVGVFVNEDPQIIAKAARMGIIDVIQLHGQEEPKDLDRLRTLCSLPVLQAFALRSQDDLIKASASKADAVLVDAPSPGSGQCFDWTMLSSLNRPFFLAGGLNADNAAAALALKGALGLDVSSGIETDGHKDPKKMRDFVQALGESLDEEQSFRTMESTKSEVQS